MGLEQVSIDQDRSGFPQIRLGNLRDSMSISQNEPTKFNAPIRSYTVIEIHEQHLSYVLSTYNTYKGMITHSTILLYTVNACTAIYLQSSNY